jgi:predicted metal-dependent enzyme (double-stranded beta helix superfamily)
MSGLHIDSLPGASPYVTALTSAGETADHAGVSGRGNIGRLRNFIITFAGLIEQVEDEHTLLLAGERLLRELIATDDWLPDAYAQPHPEHYQQYLLHADSEERFSIVSFVWGPGQQTPIHDHTVWGLVGVLRGAERVERFSRKGAGAFIIEDTAYLAKGQIDAVSPTIGDVHRVSNGIDDGVSVSIHVYGANIGGVRRSVYDRAGRAKPFISGYANSTLPNLWDKSKHP